MFERYTEEARRVIFFARCEASQFGSPYIETEHLLLGLLREDRALARRLQRSGASMDSIREEIEKRTPVREKTSTAVDLPLSQECKRVLAYAAEEAERLAHKHIGPEHLLLALLREQKCFAAELLTERGLLLSTLREEFSRIPMPEDAATRPAQSPLIALFSRDLTQEASENKLDPLIGREKELERVVEILCRRNKRSAVLVGEPGVGKTAIVHGLAQRMAEGTPRLGDKLIVALDLPQVVVIAKERGEFEEDLKEIMDELKEAGKTAIFIIEELYARGAPEGSLAAADLVKPLLSKGAIQCVALATPGDYRKWTEKALWLEEYFEAVEVPPMNEEDTLRVLSAVKGRYEMFHGITYTEEAIRYAVHFAKRYISDRRLPGAAIDLVDQAGAYVVSRPGALPEDVIDAQKRFKDVMHRMENAIANHEFEKARFYSNEGRKEQQNLRELFTKYNLDAKTMNAVTLEGLEEVVSRRTGVPVTTIRNERPADPGGDKSQA